MSGPAAAAPTGGAHDGERSVRSALDPLIDELESTARALSEGRIDGDEAARLVERSAELAARLGSELDRLARARPEDDDAGQERLL
jgi:hypothetical protein